MHYLVCSKNIAACTIHGHEHIHFKKTGSSLSYKKNLSIGCHDTESMKNHGNHIIVRQECNRLGVHVSMMTMD